MRGALTDHTAPFADRVFTKAGCHPQAIEQAHTREASTVVWLLAAMLYVYCCRTDGPYSGRHADAYKGWPNIFWHPANRAPITAFMGQFAKLRKPEHDKLALEMDEDTLRKWLGYAKKRLDGLERWLLARHFIATLTGDTLNIEEEAQHIIQVYEAKAGGAK